MRQSYRHRSGAISDSLASAATPCPAERVAPAGRTPGPARIACALWLAGHLLVAVPVAAGETDDPGTAAGDAPGDRDLPVLIEEVVVHGDRLPSEEPVRDRTVFSTRIDTSDKTAEADTAADVLADTVGVQVRRLGGIGAFSTISIRGSDPGQVQFYIDEVPISGAQNEVVDLSTLPLEAVDHIEVYRSFVPIGFSRAAPGGVVNIVTKRPGPEARTGVSASYGSFDTRKASVERSQRVGPWEYLLFGTYTGSEGDFEFENEGVSANPFDDFTDTRKNNAFDAVDVLAKGGYAFSEHSDVSLTNQLFWKDEGVPGLDTIQNLNASFEQMRSLTHLRGNFGEVGGLDLDVRTTGHLVYDRSQFSDRFDVSTGGDNKDSDDRSFAVGGDTLATYYWGRYQVPALLLAAGYEAFSPDDRLFPEGAGPDQRRVRVGLAAQDEIYLWGERLAVVPFVRWDWLQDDFSGELAPALAGTDPPRSRTDDFLSPRLGIQLRPVAPITVVGNVGQSFRAPNFTELFGDRGVVVGRSDLQPEEAFTWDVGVRSRWGPWGVLDEVRTEYGYFDNRIDDLIVLVPTLKVLRPENVGSARIRGHETVLYLEAFDHTAVTVNYTHQDPIDETTSTRLRLPGRAEDEGYVRAEIFGRWGRLFYEVNLIGDSFRDRFETGRVPSRDLHSLGVSGRPFGNDRLILTFEAKNLTDDRTRDFAGFPLPGRSYIGTIRYQF